MPPTTTVERPLWVTVPGAAVGVPCAWLALVVATALASPALVERLGAAGPVITIAALGWTVARRLPSPREWLRRYHLDDTEVTAMGPGRTVRRLPWSRIHTVTQERLVLRLVGDGIAIRVPLRPLVAAGAWSAVLARVVPALADELWTLLEEGEQVHLTPALDPPVGALVWWAWVPALVSGAFAGAAGVALFLGLVGAERAVAWLRARAGAVTLHRAGVGLRRWVRRIFASWARAEVTHSPQGLLVAVGRGGAGRVGPALPNFWAAAAVIQMRAQLGLRTGANVHFRVRLGDGGFAVVGEVEPGA